MQPQGTRYFPELRARSGVLVVDGFGIKLSVRNGQLIIRDGVGDERRDATFHRATCKLRRLVILGHEGFVTLEAVRWLADVGASVIHIDRNGRLLQTSALWGNDDPRLRRSQALAASSPLGVEISRYLLREKITGQMRVLRERGGDEAGREEIASARDALENAPTLDALRSTESRAALAYWSALASTEMTFATKDVQRVPTHWLTLGPRSSPLTNSPRSAATPGHALLNYCYALLEAECRIACLVVGLDPGLGIVHADQRARDSMALDLMEVGRPAVDAFVLELLSSRVLGVKDFHETRQGVCRVLAPLTHELTSAAPTFGQEIARATERVAKMLLGKTRVPVPTPLTEDNRSAGREGVRRSKRRAARSKLHRLAQACISCGVVLPDTSRTYCDDCLPERRQEVLGSFSSAGPAALAKMRREGKDPLSQPETKERLRQANARRGEEAAAWDADHERPDPEDFRREILPGLAEVPLGKLMQATGLSKRYVWLIRRGGYVPHPRHWGALRSLVTVV